MLRFDGRIRVGHVLRQLIDQFCKPGNVEVIAPPHATSVVGSGGTSGEGSGGGGSGCNCGGAGSGGSVRITPRERR